MDFLEVFDDIFHCLKNVIINFRIKYRNEWQGIGFKYDSLTA